MSAGVGRREARGFPPQPAMGYFRSVIAQNPIPE